MVAVGDGGGGLGDEVGVREGTCDLPSPQVLHAADEDLAHAASSGREGGREGGLFILLKNLKSVGRREGVSHFIQKFKRCRKA